MYDHESYRQKEGDAESLDAQIKSSIGFESAKTIMRGIMLEDTARRLPEVLAELRQELSVSEKRREAATGASEISRPG